MKKRVFIDMDGVLAKWCSSATIEQVTSTGYFLSRELEHVMKLAIDQLAAYPDISVYILSAVYQDDHSQTEKMSWLRNKEINIPERNWIFVPYGTNKSEYIRNNLGLMPDDVLLDDYSENLRQWHGIAIKFRNGLNGTKGSWTGRRSVSYEMSASQIAEEIVKAAYGVAA